MRELIGLLPNEDIIYFGDTGRVPYGTKSPETVQKYTAEIIRFLKSHNVKYIIAACGTVSATAADVLKTADLPFTTVLAPAVKAALSVTKNNHVGVIGTRATINSKSYSAQFKVIAPEIKVAEIACPLFVPLVEEDFTSPTDLIVTETIARYLNPLKNSEVDTLILGCTHYPLLQDAIQNYLGSDVTLINAGSEAAKSTAEFVKSENLQNSNENIAKHAFYLTDEPIKFNEIAQKYLKNLTKIQAKRVTLDE